MPISTASGTSSDAAAPLQVHQDTLQHLIKVAGFCDKSTEQLLGGWLPNQLCRFQYDDDDDDEKPTSMSRYPIPNCLFLFKSMLIFIPNPSFALSLPQE
jgi:hypothetical protein